MIFLLQHAHQINKHEKNEKSSASAEQDGPYRRETHSDKMRGQAASALMKAIFATSTQGSFTL